MLNFEDAAFPIRSQSLKSNKSGKKARSEFFHFTIFQNMLQGPFAPFLYLLKTSENL